MQLCFYVSGITQFWTDDYKVFDQIYGRTSDKELYGPAGKAIDVTKFQKTDAINVNNHQPNIDATAAGSQIDAYGFGDNFAHLRQRLKYAKDTLKPAKIANKVVYNVYRPVTEDTDPETFDYLKHLEQLGKQQTVDFPQQTVRGFQPYVNGLRAMTAMSAGADNFKSIQDILEAQDNKLKHKEKLIDDGDVKYINYAGAPSNKNKKQNLRYIESNSINTVNRCVGKNQGRCRKRSNTYGRYRLRSGPLVRKIKHTIVSD